MKLNEKKENKKFPVFDAVFYDRIMTASGAFNPQQLFFSEKKKTKKQKTHSQVSYCSRAQKGIKLLTKLKRPRHNVWLCQCLILNQN